MKEILAVYKAKPDLTCHFYVTVMLPAQCCSRVAGEHSEESELNKHDPHMFK